jgi:hypothetical protein
MPAATSTGIRGIPPGAQARAAGDCGQLLQRQAAKVQDQAGVDIGA